MTDDIDRSFDWYKAALKGARGPIDPNNPKSGFYRVRNGRNGPFVPVAFWYDSSTQELRCHKNGRSLDDLAARELWVYAAKNLVPAESYWSFIDGHGWPDNDVGAAATANGPDIDPEIDPVGSMKAEIEKAAAGVPAYKSIDSDEQAAKAQTLRSALTALSGKADKARKAKKEPHLEAGRKVDAEWQPLVNQASSLANDIRKALEAWEDIKRDNARRAAEEAPKAAREAQEAGKPAPPPPAQNTPAPSMQIRGASGRAASVGTKKVIKSIDLQKCWDKLGGLPEVYNLFMDLADKAISAGRCTAEDLGAVIEEKASIR